MSIEDCFEKSFYKLCEHSGGEPATLLRELDILQEQVLEKLEVTRRDAFNDGYHRGRYDHKTWSPTK